MRCLIRKHAIGTKYVLIPYDLIINQEFQTLLEDPVHTPFEAQQRDKKIKQIWKEFVNEAVPIAKHIIMEAHYPDELRSYQPITKQVCPRLFLYLTVVGWRSCR